mgnify:CR=1 FL=1
MPPEETPPQIDVAALSQDISQQVTETLLPFLQKTVTYKGSDIRNSKQANTTGSNPNRDSLNLPDSDDTIESMSANTYTSLNEMYKRQNEFQKSIDEKIARASIITDAHINDLKEAVRLGAFMPSSFAEETANDPNLRSRSKSKRDESAIIIADLIKDELSDEMSKLTEGQTEFLEAMEDAASDIKKSGLDASKQAMKMANHVRNSLANDVNIKTTRNRSGSERARQDESIFDQSIIDRFSEDTRLTKKSIKDRRKEGVGIKYTIKNSKILTPKMSLTSNIISLINPSIIESRGRKQSSFLGTLEFYSSSTLELINVYTEIIHLNNELDDYSQIELKEAANLLKVGGDLATAAGSNLESLNTNHIKPIERKLIEFKAEAVILKKELNKVATDRAIPRKDPVPAQFNSEFDNRIKLINEQSKLDQFESKAMGTSVKSEPAPTAKKKTTTKPKVKVSKPRVRILSAAMPEPAPTSRKSRFMKKMLNANLSNANISGSIFAGTRSLVSNIANRLSPDAKVSREEAANLGNPSIAADLSIIAQAELRREEREKDALDARRKDGLTKNQRKQKRRDWASKGSAAAVAVPIASSVLSGNNNIATGTSLIMTFMDTILTSAKNRMGLLLKNLNLKEMFSKFRDGISKSLSGIKGSIISSMKGIGSYVTGISDKLRGNQAGATKVASSKTPTKPKPPSNAKSTGFFSWVKKTAQKSTKAVGDAVKDRIQLAKDGIQFIGEKSKSYYKVLKEFGSKAQAILKKIIAHMPIGRIMSFLNTVKTMWKSFKSSKFVSKMFADLIKVFGKVKLLKGPFTKLMKSVTDKIKNSKVASGSAIGIVIMLIFLFFDVKGAIGGTVVKEVENNFDQIVETQGTEGTQEIIARVQNNTKAQAALGKLLVDALALTASGVAGFAAATALNVGLSVAAGATGVGVVLIPFINFIITLAVGSLATQLFKMMFDLIFALIGEDVMSEVYTDLGEGVLKSSYATDKIQTEIQNSVNKQKLSNGTTDPAGKEVPIPGKNENASSRAQISNQSNVAQQAQVSAVTDLSNSVAKIADNQGQMQQSLNTMHSDAIASTNNTHNSSSEQINKSETNITNIHPESKILPTYAQSNKSGKVSYS